MNIAEARKLNKLSNQDLRRARSLYFKNIRKFVTQNPQTLEFFVLKAIKRGLYSEKTGLRDVGFSIISYFWKEHTKYRSRVGGIYHFPDWQQWIDHFGVRELKGLYSANKKATINPSKLIF